MREDLLPKLSSTEMQSVPSLPPRRSGNGETIPPDVLMFLTLDDMAVRQTIATEQQIRLRELEESKIPIGTKPLKYTITDTEKEIILDYPWISLSLINDGPGDIAIWVNHEGAPQSDAMIESGETYNLDMTFPIIHSIHLKATSGTTATARIHGKEGKPI